MNPMTSFRSGFLRGALFMLVLALLGGATVAFGQILVSDGDNANPGVKFSGTGGGFYKADGGAVGISVGSGTPLTVMQGGVKISVDRTTSALPRGICIGDRSDTFACDGSEESALLTFAGDGLGVATLQMGILAPSDPSGMGAFQLYGHTVDLVTESSGGLLITGQGAGSPSVASFHNTAMGLPNAFTCPLDGNVTNPKCTVDTLQSLSLNCTCTVRGTTSLATHQTCSLSDLGAGPLYSITAYGSVASSTRTVNILCF